MRAILPCLALCGLLMSACKKEPGEGGKSELRGRVVELEADVRRLQAQIEASAELHREDQKRADDLANVPG